jgi:hypothetical protein
MLCAAALCAVPLDAGGNALVASATLAPRTGLTGLWGRVAAPGHTAIADAPAITITVTGTWDAGVAFTQVGVA